MPETPDTAPTGDRFAVAGVGASAGGVDALRRLFGAMPADTGAAFVVLPHLDPDRASQMAELLARATAMPVVEATEDVAVAPNRVYVLPPNKYLTLAGGRLRLSGPVERGGPQTSIDLFLRSLADDRQEQAVAVILSGTGAHGTLGMQAVKAGGGLTLVQDPATAEYGGMPASAIATGQADAVLAPEAMPEAIARYVRHLAGAGGADGPPADDADLGRVLDLLRGHAELDFRPYRKTTLLRRTRRRMELLRLARLPDYFDYLGAHPEEVARLAKDLLISVTSFFRDREAFGALAEHAVPDLVRRAGAGPVRAWVAGCATGEEAYSVAMLLLEGIRAAGSAATAEVLASDVAPDALAVARLGRYPEAVAADVSAARRDRFFGPPDGGWLAVGAELRAAVTFTATNILEAPPPAGLDLISCRNLLIYLEPDAQTRLVALFHGALAEGGYLLLGPSETAGTQAGLFEPVARKWRLYRRTQAAPAAPPPHPDAPSHTHPDSLEVQLLAARVERDGTNEELKATNEEMMSMNEELQASNEELETSKEEMQSLNEELSSANVQVLAQVETLRATAEHLRRLAAVLIDSNDAVTVHDLGGRITAWNRSAERVYGYPESEAVGMGVSQLLPEEMRPDGDGVLARLARGGRVEPFETRRRTKRGDLIDVWLTGTPLRDDAGKVVAAALTARDVTERKALEKEVLEIAAGEQRRIGHDLHDTAGQELTALGLMADSLAAALADHSPGDALLAGKIVLGVRRTLGLVRALSRGLVPVEVGAHGLAAALSDLAARIGAESGVRCTFECAEPVAVEDNATATHLYRIAQEAVGNALKHARATRITVALTAPGGRATLSVSDDGVGLPAPGPDPAGVGLGLRIMRYRADLVRAELSVSSPPAGGTAVTCTLGAPDAPAYWPAP